MTLFFFLPFTQLYGLYPISDIKTFIEWCSEGDSTLKLRHDLFLKQKEAMKKQKEELENTLDVLEHKCMYYQVALEAGTEDVHKREKIGNTVYIHDIN